MMNKALKCLKDCGDFEPAIRKWEAKPVASQTWDNLKRLMMMEYSRACKQDSTSARATGFASTHNVVEELAETTEEIITNLTNKHAQRIEALVKLNNDILTKLTNAIASKATATAAPTASAAANKDEKRKKLD
jgi:hypothetical protein